MQSSSTVSPPSSYIMRSPHNFEAKVEEMRPSKRYIRRPFLPEASPFPMVAEFAMMTYFKLGISPKHTEENNI